MEKLEQNTKMVTLESIRKQGADISCSISWALLQIDKAPLAPRKPILKNNHSSEDVEKYASDLKIYDEANLEYKKELEKYNIHRYSILNVIEEYIKDEACLDTIPEQYRDKVYSEAYRRGHSDGYYEVYLELLSLIEIFE